MAEEVTGYESHRTSDGFARTPCTWPTTGATDCCWPAPCVDSRMALDSPGRH